MSFPTSSRHVHVAILGGGIAGLTLALILERIEITFVLWEFHGSIAPETGAGIGLLPNGLRILDQLGLLQEVESQTVPLKTWHHIDDNGKTIATVDAHTEYYPIGYDGRFLERSKLLGMMYNAIQNKDAIKTSMELDRIENSEEYTILIATDGSWATANVIVGADGVRSWIRQHIEQSLGTSIYNEMRTRFTCIYGISPAMSQLKEGSCYAVRRKDATVWVFTSRDVIFWFVFEDLGDSYPLTYRPSYHRDDIEAACQSVRHLNLTTAVTFGHVFSNRISMRKTKLEEGLADYWHADRMVVIGDAAHKMVPQLAMGANQAMESAAALANELQRINRLGGGWTMANITEAFERYTNVRRDRVAAIISRAGMICRAQLCCPGHEQTVKAITKLQFADWMAQGLAGFRGASVVESLPLTERGKYYDERVKAFFDHFDQVSEVNKEELCDHRAPDGASRMQTHQEWS